MLAGCADYDIDTTNNKVVRGNKDFTQWTEDWMFQRSSKPSPRPKAAPCARCPNCGAPLDLDLQGVCKYCHEAVMSGEYDWVLTRIEQVLNGSAAAEFVLSQWRPCVSVTGVPGVCGIDNYDSFVYNLVQYLGELGAEPLVHRNDALDARRDRRARPRRRAHLARPGPARGRRAVSNDVIRALRGRAPGARRVPRPPVHRPGVRRRRRAGARR